MRLRDSDRKRIWEFARGKKNKTDTTRKQRERVLKVLTEADDALSQAEIAKRAKVPISIASRILNYMLKEEMVIRIGYKYEPYKPYLYVLSYHPKLETIVKQHLRCPICKTSDKLEVDRGIDIRCKCGEEIILLGVQIVDPDDIRFMLIEKTETHPY